MAEQPPQSYEDIEQAAPQEGLLETAMGVLSQPVPTLRRLTHEPKIGWAVLVVAAISLSSALATVAQGGPLQAPGLGPRFGGYGGPPASLDPQMRTFGIVLAVLAPVFAIVWLAIAAGIVQLSSYLLGGRGTYAGMFTGLGFADVPNLFGIPALLLPLVLGGTGGVLAGLLNFGLVIWVLVLSVIAVRENHGFSTGRAVAAVLIPIAALILLFVLLGIALVAAIVPNLGGQP
jgi:hypothetical protein